MGTSRRRRLRILLLDGPAHLAGQRVSSGVVVPGASTFTVQGWGPGGSAAGTVQVHEYELAGMEAGGGGRELRARWVRMVREGPLKPYQ